LFNKGCMNTKIFGGNYCMTGLNSLYLFPPLLFNNASWKTNFIAFLLKWGKFFCEFWTGKCNVYILTMKINRTLWLTEVINLFRRWKDWRKYIFIYQSYWSPIHILLKLLNLAFDSLSRCFLSESVNLLFGPRFELDSDMFLS
jgi:hypothetical protein